MLFLLLERKIVFDKKKKKRKEKRNPRGPSKSASRKIENLQTTLCGPYVKESKNFCEIFTGIK